MKTGELDIHLQPEMNVTECPVCHGSGIQPDKINSINKIVFKTDAIKCPSCHGIGQIVTITFNENKDDQS